MNVQMVSFRAKEESVAEIETAVREIVAAIRREQPQGTRFAYGRLADGVTFVGLLALEDGVENPLPGIPEARAYRERVAGWAAEPPAPQDLEIIADYGLFAAAAASSIAA